VATPATRPLRRRTRKEKLADMEYLMNKIITMLSGIAFVAVLQVPSARAEEIRAGDLVITQAWSRATPGGAKVGGGYLTIENKGTMPDRLIGGTAEVASKVQVHEMTMDDGVMKMRPVEGGLTIDPGKTVKLAPSGYHLMIMGLKSPLKQGDKVPVTLEFEKAGKVAVTLDVEGIGAQGPGSGDGMKMAPGMKM
jgi:copper(I)-binding protein